VSWACFEVAILVALLSLTAPFSRAAAHQINLSSAKLEVSSDRNVTLELALKGSDLDRVAGTKVFDDRTGLVDSNRLDEWATTIAAYVTAHAVVSGAEGIPCKAGAVVLGPDQDGVVAHVTWSCKEVRGDLLYRSTVLTAIDRTAKQVVLISAGGETSQALLDASRFELMLTAPPSSLRDVVGRYVEAGIEHIFLGYDHVAFLIAVVLWARRLWPVIKIVTAFTVAHSITLSLAALQVVVIPAAIIEPAIAASIVFVAIENFFSRDIDRRWRDTFGFGLIHGFGFAAALQEFGLPRGRLLPALAAFNLGVEVGQVAIVSLVVPALVMVDRLFAGSPHARPSRAASLVYPISGGIALLGCYWIMARTFLA
jgi:hydrogenase/urease accessory protein HupE